MSDILSQGPDREPPWWTSPLGLAVAGVVLAALLLLAHGVLGRHASHSPAAERSSPPVSPLGPPPGLPILMTPNGVFGPKEPTRFRGVEIGPSGGLRLLLTGPRPGWFWTTTGRFQPIIGLPRGGPGYAFTRVAGGWAVQQYSPPQATCLICDAPPPVYFVADRQARATIVGSAFAAAAATDSGDLWLTAFLPGADIPFASGTAQQLTVAGQVVGRPSQLPSGYVIVRAVRGDLLLAPYAPNQSLVRDELWDPVTGRLIRRFTNVIAASPNLIAWDPCTSNCPLRVLSLSTGATAVIPLAPGTWVDGGTFSSDGRLLAIQVSTTFQRNGAAATTSLEVITMASRRPIVLPGAKISSLIGVSFGWQPGSDRLVAAIAEGPGVVQVASWQPGEARLSIQALRLPSGTSPVLGDGG